MPGYATTPAISPGPPSTTATSSQISWPGIQATVRSSASCPDSIGGSSSGQPAPGGKGSGVSVLDGRRSACSTLELEDGVTVAKCGLMA